MGVITYPFWDYSQTMLVNGDPDVCEWTVAPFTNMV